MCEGDRSLSRATADCEAWKPLPDWREKQQAKAAVMQTLRLEMRWLPAQYTKDVCTEKMAQAYAYVYDHYLGARRSTY